MSEKDKAADAADAAKATAPPAKGAAPAPDARPISAIDTQAFMKVFGALATQAQAATVAPVTPGLDKSEPGGRFMVDGVLVNAWGKRVDDPEKDGVEYKGARFPGTPDAGVPVVPGRQPGPGAPDAKLPSK